MDDKHRILKQYWGYHAFRPLQDDIVDAVLAGHDVLALLPTGGGKSICFQAPAMLRDGICLVITPLIALMQDQVAQLQRRGIKAVAIYSGMSKREVDIAFDNCIYGNIKFLYLSPERLTTDLFKERLTRMDVGLIAVDEAHCISQWGYDFRPPYLQIAALRKLLPGINIIALTATATADVKLDIQDKLEFSNGKVFQKSFARANLSYAVRSVDDKDKKLIQVLKSVPGTAIVYASTRKLTKELSTYIKKQGITADYYHAGLSHAERASKQEAWIHSKVRVMVATNAFGMGIDKADVRLVVHYNLPHDIESYYQEAGRAGRDERKAYALIITHEHDKTELLERVSIQYPDRDKIKHVYQCLANYYQLAVGSGGDVAYPFELHEFAEKYQLNHLEAYYAVKRLHDESVLQLNEGFYAPSRVHITMDNKLLYEFQIANAHFDPLIKALLRLYGGELFTSFLKISEHQLAQYLTTSEEAIKKGLSQLEAMEVIEYDPKIDKPQLIFLKQRYAIEGLPVDWNMLRERQALAMSKAKAMVHYVGNATQCRTASLLAYFGEDDYDQCGICDVCIEQHKHHDHDTHTLHQQVLYHVKLGPLYVDDVIERIDPSQKDRLLEAIRQMVEAGQLQYDDNWRLEIPA